MPLEPGIVATRLYRPRVSGDLTSRPRPLEHRDRPLAPVSAPAVCGQTIPITSWLETRDRPSTRLVPDGEAAGPLLLLTHRLAATETLSPGSSDARRSDTVLVTGAPYESLTRYPTGPNSFTIRGAKPRANLMGAPRHRSPASGRNIDPHECLP